MKLTDNEFRDITKFVTDGNPFSEADYFLSPTCEQPLILFLPLRFMLNT